MTPLDGTVLSRVALHPHQVAELAFLLRTPRALLLSETGCGKTATLLAYARSVLGDGGVVVWATKKGLVRQLQAEAEVWLPASMQPMPLKDDVPASQFVVATHGEIYRRIGSLDWLVPDLLIVDEAAAVGCGGINPAGPTYAAHRLLSRRSGRSVLATATPVGSQHAMDLLALLEVGCIPGTPSRNSIDPHLHRAQIPASYGRTREFISGISDRGLALMIAPLTAHAIRTTASEIHQSLPVMVRTTVDVPLSPADMLLYDAAMRKEGLRRHQGQQSVSRSSSALVSATIGLLTEGIGSMGHGKIVVFSDYFDLVNPLVDELDAADESVIRLDGSMSAKQRNDAVHRHMSSGRHILVGTSALEEGLNLQHSSMLVTVVASWSKSRELQREGRLLRLGSLHRRVHHVTVRPDVPLEIRKETRLEVKQAIADEVLRAVPSALRT